MQWDNNYDHFSVIISHKIYLFSQLNYCKFWHTLVWCSTGPIIYHGSHRPLFGLDLIIEQCHDCVSSIPLNKLHAQYMLKANDKESSETYMYLEFMFCKSIICVQKLIITLWQSGLHVGCYSCKRRIAFPKPLSK